MSLELKTAQPDTSALEVQSPRATRLLAEAFRYAFALSQDVSVADRLVGGACKRLQQKGETFGKRSMYTAVRELFFESEVEGGELSAVASPAVHGNLAGLSSTERELVYLLSVEGWSLDDFTAHTGRIARSADGFLVRVREKMGLSTPDDPGQRALIRERPLPDQILRHIQGVFDAIDLPADTLFNLSALLPEIEKVPTVKEVEDVPFPSLLNSVKQYARKYGLKVLAGFAFALVVRSCLASSSPVRDWVRQAAEDVATNHTLGAVHEFPMTTAAELNASMSLLDFELVIDDDVVDEDDDRLLGASYASVLGRPAVRLFVLRDGEDEESVYVCRAGDTLKGMSSKSYSFDPYDVDVWEEDGLLFFEVELDD